MLAELSMVEQRYVAVREVLDTGATVTDVARRYGVDRRTLHRWLVRYAGQGLGALADRSPKPDRCPHKMPAEVEARVVELRRAHPGWGPRTILNRLRRELEEPPSRSCAGAESSLSGGASLELDPFGHTPASFVQRYARDAGARLTKFCLRPSGRQAVTRPVP